ncbi:hypothetical protein Hanom_Chr04g00281311 [Helianthus anomalus]
MSFDSRIKLGFSWIFYHCHQCLTLHQVKFEHASLKRNANIPPLDLEIIDINIHSNI